MISPLLEAARRYRRAGISVLPVAHRSKFPDAQALSTSGNLNLFGQPTWRAFGRRLASDAEITSWFASGSRNLGIVTGYGDLVILDFDNPQTYGRWLRRYGKLARRTSIQRTRHGFHVLFRWRSVRYTSFAINDDFYLTEEPGTHAGQIKSGSDYVVAWPSVHPGGSRYRWLPGQAPWQTGIVKIETLSEIGVQPVKKVPWEYVGFLAKLVWRPREGVLFLKRWLKNKYAKQTGVFFRYG